MFAMPGSKSKPPLRPPVVLTNALAADVALNNTGSLFDGPSVAQGPVGEWEATGTLTVKDTGGAAAIRVRLWDGTTIVSSTVVNTTAAGNRLSVTLNGVFQNPTGNIRMSAQDITAVTGVIAFNDSGSSKDCVITAKRIG